jgi:hypothetical protein
MGIIASVIPRIIGTIGIIPEKYPPPSRSSPVPQAKAIEKWEEAKSRRE